MDTFENTFDENNIKPIIHYYYEDRLLQYYGLCGKKLDSFFSPQFDNNLKTYMILSDNKL